MNVSKVFVLLLVLPAIPYPSGAVPIPAYSTPSFTLATAIKNLGMMEPNVKCQYNIVSEKLEDSTIPTQSQQPLLVSDRTKPYPGRRINMLKDSMKHRSSYCWFAVFWPRETLSLQNLEGTAGKLTGWAWTSTIYFHAAEYDIFTRMSKPVITSEMFNVIIVLEFGADTRDVEPSLLFQLSPPYVTRHSLGYGRKPPIWNVAFLVIRQSVTGLWAPGNTNTGAHFAKYSYPVKMNVLQQYEVWASLVSRGYFTVELHQYGAPTRCNLDLSLMQQDISNANAFMICNLALFNNVTLLEGNNVYTFSLFRSSCNDKKDYSACFWQMIREKQSLPAIIEAGLISEGRKGYTFLSCQHQNENPLTFYFKPFSLNVWLLLAASFIFIVPSLHVVARRTDRPCRVDSAFYCYAAIVMQGANFPANLERMANFRFLFLTWLLFCLVTCNAYLGMAIGEIRHPSLTPGLKDFSDIECVPRKADGTAHGYMEISDALNNLSVYGSYDHQQNPQCYSLLTTFTPSHIATRNPFESPFWMQVGASLYASSWKREAENNSLWVNNFLFSWLKEPNPYLPAKLAKMIPPEGAVLSYESYTSAVEEEVALCGRSALIVEQTEVRGTLSYFGASYPFISFYAAEQTIEGLYKNWEFLMDARSPMYSGFQKMVEAGIQSKLKLWVKYKGNLKVHKNRSSSSNTISVRLNTNIISLFAFGLALLIVATTVFLVESQHRNVTVVSNLSAGSREW